jgi:hypothetical protein
LTADAGAVFVGGFIFLWFLLIALILATLALSIWMIIDAAQRPDWQFQVTGQNKILWIVLGVVGIAVCQLAGLIAAPIYLLSVRKRLNAAVAPTYGAYPYGYGAGPPGYPPTPGYPATPGYGAAGGYPSAPGYGTVPASGYAPPASGYGPPSTSPDAGQPPGAGAPGADWSPPVASEPAALQGGPDDWAPGAWAPPGAGPHGAGDDPDVDEPNQPSSDR